MTNHNKPSTERKSIVRRGLEGLTAISLATTIALGAVACSSNAENSPNDPPKNDPKTPSAVETQKAVDKMPDIQKLAESLTLKASDYNSAKDVVTDFVNEKIATLLNSTSVPAVIKKWEKDSPDLNDYSFNDNIVKPYADAAGNVWFAPGWENNNNISEQFSYISGMQSQVQHFNILTTPSISQDSHDKEAYSASFVLDDVEIQNETDTSFTSIVTMKLSDNSDMNRASDLTKGKLDGNYADYPTQTLTWQKNADGDWQVSDWQGSFLE